MPSGIRTRIHTGACSSYIVLVFFALDSVPKFYLERLLFVCAPPGRASGLELRGKEGGGGA